jgi:hypothetical protein
LGDDPGVLIRMDVSDPPKFVPPNAAVINMKATNGFIPKVSGISRASVTVPPNPGRIPIVMPRSTPKTISKKLIGVLTVPTAVINASTSPGP